MANHASTPEPGPRRITRKADKSGGKWFLKVSRSDLEPVRFLREGESETFIDCVAVPKGPPPHIQLTAKSESHVIDLSEAGDVFRESPPKADDGYAQEC